jgi:hypothetical protein
MHARLRRTLLVCDVFWESAEYVDCHATLQSSCCHLYLQIAKLSGPLESLARGKIDDVNSVAFISGRAARPLAPCVAANHRRRTCR